MISPEKTEKNNTAPVIEKSVKDNISSVIEKSVKDNTVSVIEKSAKDNTRSVFEKSVKDNTASVIEKSVKDNTVSVIEKSVKDNTVSVIEKSVKDNTVSVIEKSVKDNTRSVIEKSDKDTKISVIEKSDKDTIISVIEKSVKDTKISVIEKSDKDTIISVSEKSDKDNTTSRYGSALRLSERPERPLDSDCCGNGCTPCVMDIYYEEMALWEAGLNQGDSAVETQVNHQVVTEEILHPTQYASFPIRDIKQETADSVRIRCGLASNQKLGLALGQHIIVRSQVPGSSLTRQYTPVSSLDAKGYFELLIKIYPEGRMSQRVQTWKVGDMLEARGPAGNLEYVRNKFRRILMLCTGSGIAPMCPVISSILSDDDEETYLRLVYACRSYDHLMAKSEIDEWTRFWNFSCMFALSQEPDNPHYRYKSVDDVYKGRVDKSIVDRELGINRDSTLVLVCGTRSFDADMLSFLKELGVPDVNVHKY